jgi:hypothetical protein
MKDDMRPAFYLDDVKGADFNFVKTQKTGGVPSLSLKNVTNLNLFRSLNLNDRKVDNIINEKL